MLGRYFIIILFWCGQYPITTCAQSQKFSRIYEEVSQSSVTYLTEDEQYYYSIDYAENFGSPELGFAIRTYEKTTGEIVRFLYHTIPNSWMFHGRCKKVVHIGTKMYFVYLVVDTIYLYVYDKASYQLEVLDTIVHPSKPVFTWDLQYINNKILLTYNTSNDNDSTISKIAEFDSKGIKGAFDIITKKELIMVPGLIRKLSQEKILATGRWSNRNANNFLNRVGIFEMDTLYNVISEWWTPLQDNALNASDVIVLNEEELLLMIQVIGKDQIINNRGYPHYVYKFNLKEGKVIWKKNFTLPESTFTTSLGALAVGHQEDTYFMCSSTYDKKVKRLDTIFTVGRVVKFRGNGNVIWQRDYNYFNSSDHGYNHFNNMISTLDGHYLIGGKNAFGFGFKSWLVKINEDGHILGDTTSSILWEQEKWKENISIYPNPVQNLLYINQDEIQDIEYVLMDISGRVVEKIFQINAHSSIVWDISHLSKGTYILSIRKKGKVIGTSKILKV